MSVASFRTARREDAPVLAQLMRLADMAHYPNAGFDLSFGPDPEHQIGMLQRLAESEYPTPFHYSHFEVAERDGQILAGLAGFDRQMADAFIEPALHALGWSDTDIAALYARVAPIYQVYPPDSPASWTIDQVASFPQARRQGLLRPLFQRILDRARDAGARSVQLEVFEGNIAAQRLYESLGFQVTETFGKEVFGKLLSRRPMHRMTLLLA